MKPFPNRSLRHPDPGGKLATRSDGVMECWSAESTNTPPLHHSVWDHADSKEMTNRRKGSGVLSLIRSALAVCWLSGSLALESRAAEPTGPKWQVAPGYRWAALPVPTNGRNGFTLMPANKTGIWFTNLVGDERSVTNRNLLTGSGVALGDIDGDGLCDIYFCRLDGDNVLYRNLGNWTFEDITKSAGVACPNEDATGACFADIDGDGDLDLLVNSLGGGTRIFENDGKGHFHETTDQAGVRSKAGSTS